MWPILDEKIDKSIKKIAFIWIINALPILDVFFSKNQPILTPKVQYWSNRNCKKSFQKICAMQIYLSKLSPLRSRNRNITFIYNFISSMVMLPFILLLDMITSTFCHIYLPFKIYQVNTRCVVIFSTFLFKYRLFLSIL